MTLIIDPADDFESTQLIHSTRKPKPKSKAVDTGIHQVHDFVNNFSNVKMTFKHFPNIFLIISLYSESKNDKTEINTDSKSKKSGKISEKILLSERSIIKK